MFIPVYHLSASSWIPNAVFVHVVDSEPIFFRCGDDVRRLRRLTMVCYTTRTISLLYRVGGKPLLGEIITKEVLEVRGVIHGADEWACTMSLRPLVPRPLFLALWLLHLRFRLNYRWWPTRF
jgi:hypothetical protein